MLIITTHGKLIRLEAEKIRATGRSAQGVKLIEHLGRRPGGQRVARRAAERAGRRRGGSLETEFVI